MRAGFAIGAVLAWGVVLAGCATAPPPEALELSPDSLERRQLQTRRFDGVSEDTILAASAGVLQDLGFNLDESETELGVIVASKHRSAEVPAQRVRQILLAVLLDVQTEVDEHQRIRVSLVTRPAGADNESYHVRVTFQRVVWDTANEVSATEAIDDPVIYQQFFERLSKSVFLEAHKI